jgi:hypothetical protein
MTDINLKKKNLKCVKNREDTRVSYIKCSTLMDFRGPKSNRVLWTYVNEHFICFQLGRAEENIYGSSSAN